MRTHHHFRSSSVIPDAMSFPVAYREFSLKKSTNIGVTVCNIMLKPGPYTAYQLKSAFAIDINMILHTFFPMFVDFFKR